MDISTSQVGSYRLFSLEENLSLNSDISKLKELIYHALDEGIRSIALRFTEHSYLSTRTIAVLVTCFEEVKDRGGRLAIINPNEDILDVLGMIDLDRVVDYYPSENMLTGTTKEISSHS